MAPFGLVSAVTAMGGSTMQKLMFAIGVLATALVAEAAETPLAPQMNVTQGPETVFSTPPADIFPALAGAARTKEAGRVGSAMVFWGYQQSSGARVFLFACAETAEVACEQRVQVVCPNVKVLNMQTATGNVVRRSCRNITSTSVGEVRPGCDDREEMAPLSIGLLACGG
jgi:hypothetical protein